MTNVVGMIVEYNPFHNGHLWHLNESKKRSGAEFAVALMSGSFTQRGEPALFNKWLRAEAAVCGGVDLVLELPAVYAVRSAQYFATAGVRLFQRLGIVTYLSFGAEHPDADNLERFALAIDDKTTLQALKLHLRSGCTYADALARALSTHPAILRQNQDTSHLLSCPNNILAIEYLRAIHRYAPDLARVILPRQQASHRNKELTAPYASASAIRLALHREQRLSEFASSALPASTARLIHSWLEQNITPATWENLSLPLLYRLRTLTPEQISLLPEVSEGLHHRIAKNALQASSVHNLLERLKTKRYPLTRLQRVLVHTLLGTTRQELSAFDQAAPPYARVLAFNQKGRRLLHRLRQESRIPLIIKTTHFTNSVDRFSAPPSSWQRILSLDTLASDIYTLASAHPQERAGGQDFVRSPRYIET